MRENAAGHTHWVCSCAGHAPSQIAKGEWSLSDVGKSGTLLKSFYRTEPQVPAKVSRPSPVVSSAECRPPGLLHMLHPSVRHYAANRVSRSTGSGAERELESKGLDNLHYSRSTSRSVRASDQPVSSARRAGSNRDRRPQVRIAEGGRELQAKCRRKAETNHKETHSLKRYEPEPLDSFAFAAVRFIVLLSSSLSRTTFPHLKHLHPGPSPPSVPYPPSGTLQAGQCGVRSLDHSAPKAWNSLRDSSTVLRHSRSKVR